VHADRAGHGQRERTEQEHGGDALEHAAEDDEKLDDRIIRPMAIKEIAFPECSRSAHPKDGASLKVEYTAA
jgi:hypothetical protein